MKCTFNYLTIARSAALRAPCCAMSLTEVVFISGNSLRSISAMQASTRSLKAVEVAMLFIFGVPRERTLLVTAQVV